MFLIPLPAHISQTQNLQSLKVTSSLAKPAHPWQERNYFPRDERHFACASREIGSNRLNDIDGIWAPLVQPLKNSARATIKLPLTFRWVENGSSPSTRRRKAIQSTIGSFNFNGQSYRRHVGYGRHVRNGRYVHDDEALESSRLLKKAVAPVGCQALRPCS